MLAVNMLRPEPFSLDRNTLKNAPFPPNKQIFTDKPQHVCKISSNVLSVGDISKLNWKSKTLQPVEEFLALIMEKAADWREWVEGSLGTYSTVHYEMFQGSGRLKGSPTYFRDLTVNVIALHMWKT